MFKVITGMELTQKDAEVFDEFLKRVRWQWYQSTTPRNIAIDLLSCRNVGNEVVVHETLRAPGFTIQLDLRGTDSEALTLHLFHLLLALDQEFKPGDPLGGDSAESNFGRSEGSNGNS